ncbi:hypothetical protein A2230_05775 [candidate division WOR-1 bacterium RIFOXYA2_FULL_36_21]|uniref:Four helix bundle protein n=1 Tax=candidate division WOR-1 bacterium RIFOXYB2_FULL_36_35 TaxID=1802578 RepID=A0A1F4S8Y8_UNCSA|nr:MAG: hypothetical protein A2230_05775 [candidate division WOR-1 bacterium RIFOXYA2_FULL_36_21]OGC16874.1 MAG: hypothetical protein A2290_05060 [candidate division WOR-1 bacterium RIFOXYB2_FULL_36_35]OGC18736.1 MAG: hypothetical protein A2282_07150 [candidate division WOR-1 bacterium RIFOXYA12_FULL_36_13]
MKPSHEKLWVWQKANNLHLNIYKICKTLPLTEKYNLRYQIERSSKSVKDNIAEGNESYYFKDKMKAFYIARKEASETQNHLRDFESKKYLASTQCQEMIDIYEEIKRGINGLIKRTRYKQDVFNNKGSKNLT